MRQLHVAVSQVCSVAGNPWQNLERMRRQIASASAVGVEVILFAETAVHAYDFSPENLAFAEPVGGPLTSRLAEWAQQYNIAILAGFIEKNGDLYHNSHLVARPDGTLGVERKHVLTPCEIEGGLTPGQRERTVFEFNGIRTALIICADSGMEGLFDMLQELQIEYRFCPTAGGMMINGKPIPYIHETELVEQEQRDLATEYRGYVNLRDAFIPSDRWPIGFAAANALGYDGRQVRHMGHCMVVDPYGTMRAQIPGTLIIEHQEDQMVHALLTFPEVPIDPASFARAEAVAQ